MFAKSWLVRLPIGIPFLGAFLLSLSLSLSRQVRRVAIYNIFKKPESIGVDNLSLKNFKEDVLVQAVKELPHVALERPARPRAIAALCAQHLGERAHAFMVALADLDIPILKKTCELYKTFHEYGRTVPKQDRFTIYERSENLLLDTIHSHAGASR